MAYISDRPSQPATTKATGTAPTLGAHLAAQATNKAPMSAQSARFFIYQAIKELGERARMHEGLANRALTSVDRSRNLDIAKSLRAEIRELDGAGPHSPAARIAENRYRARMTRERAANMHPSNPLHAGLIEQAEKMERGEW